KSGYATQSLSRRGRVARVARRLGGSRGKHGVACMLTFYFAPGSSSMAPHIGLHEVGAPFEPRPMSFKSGELRRPEYLALNPEGKVPTLVIDGSRLTEGAAILFYLARRFPTPGPPPKAHPAGTAHARSVGSRVPVTPRPAR